jgi:ribosomal protein L29
MASTKKAPVVKASKKLEASSIKDLSKADLLKKVTELQEELTVLKRGTTIGDVQNVHAYSTKRKDLARVLTALNNQSEEENK